jgi:hypothetical protein
MVLRWLRSLINASTALLHKWNRMKITLTRDEPATFDAKTDFNGTSLVSVRGYLADESFWWEINSCELCTNNNS